MTLDEQQEDASLTELLSREYGNLKDENKPKTIDKSKLKKLQLLIDQSKAFSQIISSSLVQKQTENSTKEDKDDSISLKKQKISNNGATRNAHGQPKSLTNVILKPHQLNGMNWLISLFENGLNGILADEMGLGKTVQTIALLAFLKEQGISGPFLIVAPLSVVSNWTTELSTFCPTLSFVPYIGNKKHRAKLRRSSLRKFNVVVTSYEISLIDFQYLKNITWSYLVVDEGHRLKNANCMLFTKLKALDVSNRLLLTGTPLQNNLAELWSLLNFILPDVFHDFATFQNYFNFSEFESLVEVENENGEDAESQKEFNTLVSMGIRKALVNNLHTILKPFILRRLKKDVLTLPPKREYIIYSELSSLQAHFYSMLLKDNINFRNVLLDTFLPLYIKYNYPYLLKELPDFLKWKKDVTGLPSPCPNDEINSHYEFVQSQLKSKRVSNPLMQLRQICDSPYHYFFPWNDDTVINTEMIENTSKLQSLDSIIPRIMRERPDDKILIFSQFKYTLELLDTYFTEHPSRDTNGSAFPIKTCVLTGSSSKEERDEALDRFMTDPTYKIFLLSTRAANLGLNLTAATTVILYDSDLNPMVDLQAIARIHRIGQTKPCLVYRLATRATVEEAIWEKVIKKRVLEGIVIEMGDFDGSDQWKTSNHTKSKKESMLQSLLDFYSMKRTNSNKNRYVYNDKENTGRSNDLTAGELDELLNTRPEMFADGRVLDSGAMPHIKLLSENDVTGQNALDSL